jgi:catechol 2,3-dioxygenase-like lactoylglutathione lyase family enzyme
MLDLKIQRKQMNLNYVYTRLNVRDYPACKLFYQDVLGLKVSMVNDAQEYTEFDAGATKITILNRSRLKEYINLIETVTYDPDDTKVVLTFTVPNLDEASLVPRGFASAHLKSKGVSIVSSPWQFSEDGLTGGAISACIRDPDGNLIELEQWLS